MNIAITFRHIEPSEPVKKYAQEKIAKLQKFLRQPMQANVTLDMERIEHRVEVRELEARRRLPQVRRDPNRRRPRRHGQRLRESDATGVRQSRLMFPLPNFDSTLNVLSAMVTARP